MVKTTLTWMREHWRLAWVSLLSFYYIYVPSSGEKLVCHGSYRLFNRSSGLHYIFLNPIKYMLIQSIGQYLELLGRSLSLIKSR